jgi:hypothetical protein
MNIITQMSLMFRKQRKKKVSQKKHCGSITQDDIQPGSNTSMDHVDTAHVPGYTWKHK